ncbi:hypothetical protein AXG93_3256s1850 [Marchantia polymorpha subsp. ruderalis]|uniref:RING-Gid-type domain-containing protein n=1 Tax=Marchantia polymorpha subsp. ruderalis TaxID=1480154 RepID=A0A176VJ10_MARPO|nr:hypothetical protein AXG93_3256s1850 [Marchantia polymorpha subsp. ruderalis]
MDLTSIRDAFDRVSKKQKVSYSKTQEVIEKVQQEIEKVAKSLVEIPNGPEAGDQKRALLVELQTKLSEMGPSTQVGASQKEVNLAVSKYGKVVDKIFCTDIANAYRDVQFDHHVINQIVALHFYRQGLFDLGDCFVKEAHEADGAGLKAPFYEMYQILEQMKAKNLLPAISWATRHHDELQKKGSSLEFKLHQLQFVNCLHQGGRNAALQYARSSFVPFASNHMTDIQRLMGCLLWAERLQSSPYADMLAATHWDSVATEFTRECCSLLGQAYESPLHVTISAGAQALPTLVKLATIMANKKQEWQNMKQLPVEIELSKEFQFHSIFACPVSRDPSTAENPPMLMPCGHVLCKQSIQKLAKGSCPRLLVVMVIAPEVALLHMESSYSTRGLDFV